MTRPQMELSLTKLPDSKVWWGCFISSSAGVGCSSQSQPTSSISYSSNLSLNSCQVPFISTSVTTAGPSSATSGSPAAKVGQEERCEGCLVWSVRRFLWIIFGQVWERQCVSIYSYSRVLQIARIWCALSEGINWGERSFDQEWKRQ